MNVNPYIRKTEEEKGNWEISEYKELSCLADKVRLY